MLFHDCRLYIYICGIYGDYIICIYIAGDLPDLQAPPQPCSIKNKTDSDNTGLDNNDNNNNNNNNNNKDNFNAESY